MGKLRDKRLVEVIVIYLGFLHMYEKFWGFIRVCCGGGGTRTASCRRAVREENSEKNKEK